MDYESNLEVLQVLELWNFSKDISSDYEFLLPILNPFTVGTEEYHPRCYKLNDGKAFKNPYHNCYQIPIKSCRLAQLIRTFLNQVKLVLYIIGSD